MAHRALTLKYRPQVFADMVGQDHVSTVLMRAVESGRVAHAYLFTGARGVGKTTSARILAKSLNCERRAAGELKGADPCNACTSCLEITAGISLDVAEIDGASNRGIADVQALREKVRFTPTGGRYRVVIIDEVHQLSNDAFAALLKTLEEPPAHLVFIFATTDPQKLPETIRSRTQRFDFARVPLRKVAERLFEIQRREQSDPEGVRFELSDGAAFLIARKSEGSMRDAVSALDQVVSAGESDVNEELARRVLGIPDREAFFSIAGAVTARDPKATLRSLHEAFTKGLDARELAEGLAEHVRHLLVLQVDPDGGDLVPASAEELSRLRAQGEGWSETDLLRLLKIVSEVPQVMKDSPQPLVHLEAAVMQMATLEPGETLGQILDRLQALERRMGGGAPEAGGPRGPGSAASRSASASSAGERMPVPSARAAPASGAPAPSPSVSATRTVPAPAMIAPPSPARPSFLESPSATAPIATASAAVVAAIASPVPATFAATTAIAMLEEVPAAATLGDAVAATATLVAEPTADVPDAELRWREVIGVVNGRKRMLGAFLEESRFGGVIGGTLTIDADDLHCNVIDERENRAIVAAAILEVFGRAVPFRCGAPVAAFRPAAPTNQDVRPMIEQAIAFFDGEIVEPTARRATAPPPGRKERPRA